MNRGPFPAWTLTAALMIVQAMLGRAPGDDKVVVTLGSGSDATRVALDLRVDGTPPREAWNATLDRLHAHFDRNRDGGLDREECGRMMPLPLVKKRQLRVEFERADADASGAISRDEFAAFCERHGFGPVVVVFESPAAADRQLARAFASRLDADSDGRFAAEELQAAPQALRSLDLNEDERWELAELLSAAPDADDSPSEPAAALGEGAPDATLIVELAKGQEGVELAGEGNAMLVLIGKGRWRSPRGTWVLGVQPERVLPRMASAGDFLLAQFHTSLGARRAIAHGEIDRDANLSSLRELAPLADRDGDDRLTVAELEAYAALIAALVRDQIWIVVADRGQNIAPTLDTDGDGILSYAELAGARRLADAGGRLPRQFQVSLGTAPVRTYGGMLVPAIAKRTAAPAAASSSDKPWFAALDRNRDGVLSPREFVGPPEVFARLDANADGMISAAEASAK